MNCILKSKENCYIFIYSVGGGEFMLGSDSQLYIAQHTVDRCWVYFITVRGLSSLHSCYNFVCTWKTTFDLNTLHLHKHYAIQESGTLDVHKIYFDLARISVFSYKMSGLCNNTYSCIHCFIHTKPHSHIQILSPYFVCILLLQNF